MTHSNGIVISHEGCLLGRLYPGTAVYLCQRENSPDPWGETARRKPEKADKERLIQAKNLYRKLREAVPELPVLPE